MKIINTDGLDSAALSNPNTIKKIQEFKDRIQNTGVICKKDVLSIEEAVGAAIITTKTHINMFSNSPTSIGLDSVNASLDEIITKHPVTSNVTYEGLVTAITDSKSKCRSVIESLKAIKNIPSDVMGRLVNEKFIYSYVDNNNNEGNDVTDITRDSSMIRSFLYRNDYLNGVVSSVDNSGRLFDKVKHLVNELINSDGVNVDNEHTPLLCVIKSDAIWKVWSHENYTLDFISIRDVIDIYNNIDKHIESLEDFHKKIVEDYTDVVLSETWYITTSAETFMRHYRGYVNVNNILSDNVSTTLLEILKEFTPKRN
jgi:hypothetical protein